MTPHYRALLLIVLAVSAQQAVATTEFTSIKPLLLQAIDAPDGRAEGIVVGPIALHWKASTKSTAPLLVEVTTLKRLKQEGCRRLNVRFKQENVASKEGKQTEFAMDYGINVCRDGSPPFED